MKKIFGGVLGFGGLVLLAGVLFFAFTQNGVTEEAGESGETVTPFDDIVLGDATAPVEVIEYASLTCSHCADFHKETYPALKEKYVETGKVTFIYRDFPLDRVALLMALSARCMPDEKYYSTISDFMSQQRKIASQENHAAWLVQYAAVNGVPVEEFTACIESEDNLKKVVQSRLDAGKAYGIQGTPAFVINGEVYDGGRDVNAFSEYLDARLKDQ